MAVVRIRAIPSSLSPHSLRRRVFHSGRARAEISPAAGKKRSLALVKRRTRSNSEFNLEAYSQISEEKRIRISEHFPVMLGEILQVFSERNLHSFVDCTVGAGGHSSAVSSIFPLIFITSTNLVSYCFILIICAWLGTVFFVIFSAW